MLAEFGFWAALVGIVYAIAGYPIVLALLTTRRGRPSPTPTATTPTATLIVSAHNEEAVIAEKLENSLALKYPAGQLEILVASDGSTDRTNEIVQQFASSGVRLLVIPQQQGKSLTLNATVPTTRGEVVIFTDANAMLNEYAVLQLVRRFDDPRIGFVTGWTRYRTRPGSEIIDAASSYGNLEVWLKTRESLLHSCAGADGAIFAIRKHLFRPLDEAVINDLVIPLLIIQQGYRGVLEMLAFCQEATEARARQELSRQIRIQTRTIRAILSHAALLNPVRFGWFAVILGSHKVLRLCVPILLLVLLVTSAVLVIHDNRYVPVLALQLLFYGMAAVGWAMWTTSGFLHLLKLPFAFLMVNLAVLIAWIRVLAGRRDAKWVPTREVPL